MARTQDLSGCPLLSCTESMAAGPLDPMGCVIKPDIIHVFLRLREGHTPPQTMSFSMTIQIYI